MESTPVPWKDGAWTHPPAAAEADGGDLVVTAVEGSDAWRTTSYGFVHASEHALTRPMGTGTSVEVCFTAALDHQFDQAGIFLRVSPERWIKAGVEYADGVPQLGAVVTDGCSDWSASPVPTWAGKRVTMRASRTGDAITIRARAGGGRFRFVRLAPLDPAAELTAGPYLCAPTRAGLRVSFHSWSTGPADRALH